MDSKIIDLYDRFTHGGMSRRDFMDRLGKLAGSRRPSRSCHFCRTIMHGPRSPPPTTHGWRPNG